jgi:N-dimethylarginine dimethylaminohydrolase
MRKFGSQSEIKPIRTLLLKHPLDAYESQQNIDRQWASLNYSSPPEMDKSISDYNHFVELLGQLNITITFLPKNSRTTLDSVYTHDPVVISNSGAILCNMGKPERSGEPSAIENYLNDLSIPILGKIKNPGLLEGGDVVWLDERHVAVGEGYRSNKEGIDQFRKLLSNLVDEVLTVPLPHWDGPQDCLHLMSMISPLDTDLAVVYSRMMPIPFRSWLLSHGYTLIDVPDSEFNTMACNILAVGPRKCVMLAGNPETQALLIRNGVKVWTYDGSEISIKGAGGPTCLTRPLLRES